jgi:hypothetical protein
MLFGLLFFIRTIIMGFGIELSFRPTGVLMGKGLEKILEKNKPAIVKQWFNLAAQTYAIDTAQFLKSKSDPFANPVGNAMMTGLDGILEQLIHTLDPKALNSHLDSIIRIRAIQDFTPSQATAFILSLKKVLRDYLAKELQDSRLAAEFIELESKIDQICLMAFDIYMQCREKVYQISANETRNRTFKAFERAGLIKESQQ